MRTFDGTSFAQRKEQVIASQVAQLSKKPKVGAVLFVEDEGSTLYSGLKQEAAQRVGMEYILHSFSISDDVEKVVAQITALNQDATISGIIIQKPTQRVWAKHLGMEQGSETKIAYTAWWSSLVTAIAIEKDVDGLHPDTLEAVKNNTWQEQGRVLPATCQAVIEILANYIDSSFDGSKVFADTDFIRVLGGLENKKIIILGKSDLIGKPLYYYLHNLDIDAEMIGSKELTDRVASGVALTDADIIITATGRHNLITGDMVQEGVALIDVGEPRADVQFDSVAPKASFITPVPGGVGPMTVACLLQNAVTLISR